MPEPAPEFIRLEISVVRAFEPKLSTVVEDGDDIRRILSFFPNVGQHLFSGVGGGWTAHLVITAFAPDRTKVEISVDRQFSSWSEDDGGDWPVPPGFRECIVALLGPEALPR